MLLVLLTRILVWAAVGLIIWYLLLKIIPRKFLTWFGGAIILALIVLSFLDPNDQTIGTIWRVISLPLNPLGASVLLLVFSLTDGIKKVKGQQVAIALAILLLSSVPMLARGLVNQAEQAVQEAYNVQKGICEDVCPTDIPTAAPLNRVVTMVVMGENIDTSSSLNEFSSQVVTGSSLTPSLESRLLSASVLYQDLRQNGSNPFVFVTAGPTYGSAEEQADKQQVIRNALTRDGIPANVIVIRNSGMDVNRTIRELDDFLESNQLRTPAGTPRRDVNRIAIVAPALTMRRTALAFEERQLDVMAWPTDLYGGGGANGDTLAKLSDLVPSVDALRLTTRYWEELLTSIYYFLRGWLPGFNVRWNQVVEVVPR
ncbi:MAG: YdcF family protein [Cyanobacteria bacterium]|nr:YdcF family protein [Cyanobacteriota bacterium]MDA0866065.1 YdcF family protein [Cyanobacteriota bacterium]